VLHRFGEPLFQRGDACVGAKAFFLQQAPRQDPHRDRERD
jgi:hypothetical protein